MYLVILNCTIFLWMKRLNILKLIICIIFQHISTDKTRGKYFQNVNTFKKSSQASRHRYRSDFPRFSDVALV